ncbi:MAG: SDR family NAD(P)-dependent oxidoreductase, partial [Pirellulales bacterium]
MISKSFWHGKSVLVTGGSSGIGRALGLAAAASGSRVGIIARKRPPLEATLADLRARGAIAEAIACDVADAEGLRAAVTML